MKLTWLGHACFLLEEGGHRIVTDPYDAETLTKPLHVEAEVVTISHEHHDHAFVAAVQGDPLVLRGSRDLGWVRIDAFESFHDGAQGARRGTNRIFRFAFPEVTVVHLGDLGHPLSADQRQALGRFDLLLLPVGGVYTLEPNQAAEEAKALRAPAVIPMHYYTPDLKFPLGDVEDFLEPAEALGFDVAYRPDVSLTLPLPLTGDAPQVFVLDYV